jgi:asparagine synthase (glutamine-hydrolysing)
MKQDQMSMAASIESRVPFLDHELVEHVVRTPVQFKIRGLTTKAILREALRGRVPREILHRRKLGFPVPFGRWARERFAPLIRTTILGPRALARGLFARQPIERLVAEHEAGTVNHADQLWLLLNLEIWQRIFLDGEDPATVGSV